MKLQTFFAGLTIVFCATISPYLSTTLTTLQQQTNCISDLDCPLTQFCHESAGHCICLDTLKPNPNPKPGSPACIPQRVLDLDSTTACTSSSQCIPFAECDTSSGKCHCTSGGVKLFSRWMCWANCATDADCAPYHNVECRAPKLSLPGVKDKEDKKKNKTCYCRHGFSSQDGTCTRSMSPLGGPCDTNSTGTAKRTLSCGSFAVCRTKNGDGHKAETCACRVESMPDKENGAYNCKINHCSTDADCQKQHQNTICSDYNACKCAANFEYHGDGCALQKGISKLGEHCQTNSDCSYLNAECGKKGVCQCKGNNKPLTDGVNCGQVRCVESKNCTVKNDAWMCDSTSHYCYSPSAAYETSQNALALSMLFGLICLLYL